MTHPQFVFDLVQKIRTSKPLIHNITNYVVMNQTANALLSIGASPIMAHAPEELLEIASLSNALVVNIGTLDDNWIKSIKIACKEAKKHAIPVILDPVGAGFTRLRTNFSRELVSSGDISIIRCNASEAASLIDDRAAGHGVDSIFTSDQFYRYINSLRTRIVEKYNVVLCISGEKDFIISADKTYVVNNGHPIMSRVTGMGCTASSIAAAFAAVHKSDLAFATLSAMVVMGICGEQAALISRGTGSFQTIFFDELYNINFENINSGMRVDDEQFFAILSNT